MLVIDPKNRITVEEALKHPYVNLWYDKSEVETQAPSQYDSSVECEEHSIDDWKELIYNGIKTYEATHDIYGTYTTNKGHQ